jgi:hypothetical protein
MMKLEFVLYSMQRVLVGTMQSRQRLLQSTTRYEGSFHLKKYLCSIFDCSLMDTRVLYALRMVTRSHFSPRMLVGWLTHLVETATLGYLSDPSDIPLYFRMGKDKDGLHIYCTI